MSVSTTTPRPSLREKGTGRALTASLLAVSGAVALPGCSKAVVEAWHPIYNGALLALVLVALLAVAAMLRHGLRRQRTIDDDREVTARRAIARSATDALYTYVPRPADGALVYDWDHVDDHHPLGWTTGFLTGRLVADMIPAGPEGDEARAVYRRCAEDGVGGSYIRTDRAPDGRLVTARYTHEPLPGGGGVVLATPLSPDIDAARDERDGLRADNERLTARLAEAKARIAALTEQMQSERTMRSRVEALLAR